MKKQEERKKESFSSKKERKKRLMLSSSCIRRGQRRALGLSRCLLRNASLSSSFSFASSSTRRERRQLFKEEQKPEQQHDDDTFFPEKNERRTAYIETYGCQMNVSGQRSHRRRVNLARVRDHREQRENDFDDISSGSDFGEHVRDTRQSGGTSENETETVSL